MSPVRPGENFPYVFKAALRAAARRSRHAAPCRFATGAATPAARGLRRARRSPRPPRCSRRGLRLGAIGGPMALCRDGRTSRRPALRLRSGPCSACWRALLSTTWTSGTTGDWTRPTDRSISTSAERSDRAGKTICSPPFGRCCHVSRRPAGTMPPAGRASGPTTRRWPPAAGATRPRTLGDSGMPRPRPGARRPPEATRPRRPGPGRTSGGALHLDQVGAARQGGACATGCRTGSQSHPHKPLPHDH